VLINLNPTRASKEEIFRALKKPPLINLLAELPKPRPGLLRLKSIGADISPVPPFSAVVFLQKKKTKVESLQEISGSTSLLEF
jgi:hypothetical protein